MSYFVSSSQVDLAVIEVGIGGAYDCTNIVRYGVKLLDAASLAFRREGFPLHSEMAHVWWTSILLLMAF